MQKHKNKIGIQTTNSLIQCKERGALTFEVCNLIHIFSIQRFPLKCQVFKKRDFLLLENLCHLNSSYCLIPVLCSAFTFRDRDKVKVCSQDECSLGFIIWMRELLIDARPVSHGSLCLCPAALISPTQSLTPDPGLGGEMRM